MNLKQFAETYKKLENKAIEIMKIHAIGHYDLDGIEVEEHNGKVLFNIKTSMHYSGCGTESEWLTFNLDEMNNEIVYFLNKYKIEIEAKKNAVKVAKQKEVEKYRIAKEASDIAIYKRLKLKFENK